MDKPTVSLDDYINYLMKKWKIILIFVLIFVLLFLFSVKVLGKNIVIAPSEEYFALKEEAASIGRYIENAPLMEIDATSVKEIVVYVSNISEKDALKNYINSGSVWNEFGNDKIFYSFYDLVTWTEGPILSVAEIKIQHYDEKECSLMAEFLKEEIQGFDKNAEVLIGTPYVATDESIADVQIWYKNRMNAIEGQMEHARAGYIIEVNYPVAVITGVLTGGLAAVVTLLFSFCFRRNDRKMY